MLVPALADAVAYQAQIEEGLYLAKQSIHDPLAKSTAQDVRL